MKPPSTIGCHQKLCKHCGSVRPLDDFYPDKKTKDGKSYYCKSCLRERARTWAKVNPERAKARHAAWVESNPDKAKAHQSKSYASGKWRDGWYRRAYGISEELYLKTLERQKGKCAICGTTEPGGRGRFHVDHDHKSGAVRKLLCKSCNYGLGNFKDRPDILRLAADYLDGFSQEIEKKKQINA